MEAITIYRLFESSGRLFREQAKHKFAHSKTFEVDPSVALVNEERRHNLSRRHDDRRGPQQPVLLNTRKPQSRRCGMGRRVDDPKLDFVPTRISIRV